MPRTTRCRSPALFGEALATGRSVDGRPGLAADQIDAVTADQVVAAAKKYLDIRRSVTGYLVGVAAETRS